jgi:hypothetical protein
MFPGAGANVFVSFLVFGSRWAIQKTQYKTIEFHEFLKIICIFLKDRYPVPYMWKMVGEPGGAEFFFNRHREGVPKLDQVWFGKRREHN